MILIKVGGGKNINWSSICQDLSSLAETEKLIIVHGASVQRDQIAKKLGIPTQTVTSPSGISSVYTDETALDVFLMVYAGLVNKKTVALMRQAGLNAIGLSGVDGGLWRAKAKKNILVKEGKKVKLLNGNLTGRVEAINTQLIKILVENDYIPVICPPALSFENEIVNTDNDWAIAVMAKSLKIKRMVSVFEAPGLLANPDDEHSLIPIIARTHIDDYLSVARNRMKKKILGAKKALEGGVDIIYWGDSRIPNPITSALNGEGTVIQ